MLKKYPTLIRNRSTIRCRLKFHESLTVITETQPVGNETVLSERRSFLYPLWQYFMRRVCRNRDGSNVKRAAEVVSFSFRYIIGNEQPTLAQFLERKSEMFIACPLYVDLLPSIKQLYRGTCEILTTRSKMYILARDTCATLSNVL